MIVVIPVKALLEVEGAYIIFRGVVWMRGKPPKRRANKFHLFEYLFLTVWYL